MEQPANTIDRGKILEEALSLPEADRAYLAQSLQESLPESYDWVAHLRPDLRQVWREEIQRRLKDLDEGRAELVDGEVLMRRFKDRFGHPSQVS